MRVEHIQSIKMTKRLIFKELRVQLPDKLIETTINLYQPKC